MIDLNKFVENIPVYSIQQNIVKYNISEPLNINIFSNNISINCNIKEIKLIPKYKIKNKKELFENFIIRLIKSKKSEKFNFRNNNFYFRNYLIEGYTLSKNFLLNYYSNYNKLKFFFGSDIYEKINNFPTNVYTTNKKLRYKYLVLDVTKLKYVDNGYAHNFILISDNYYIFNFINKNEELIYKLKQIQDIKL